MNNPSHYQSAFFDALNGRADVDLQVVYFQGVPDDRAAEGWNSEHADKSFEKFSGHATTPTEILSLVPDWSSRVHVISSNFNAALVDYFCEQGTKWCHWSEMPGIRLVEMLGYRMRLFRFLHPLMLLYRRKEWRPVRDHALGVFAQGILAADAFDAMGIPDPKIHDLFYTPAALPGIGKASSVTEFAVGRRVFLSVGALCKRKAIDIILKAFTRLHTADWCLVLCGLDKTNGEYHALARQLGIADRVLFLGAYPADKISEVYAASDVFVLASRFDGWGAVLNEAASLGLPLIGTDLCGASWHVVEDGLNGYRVKAASVSAMTRAMRVYVETPDLLEKHGKVSRMLFSRELTPEKNAERLVSALTKWMPA
jgi:glycosyltransferase involved in cell wall biosynthesis